VISGESNRHLNKKSVHLLLRQTSYVMGTKNIKASNNAIQYGEGKGVWETSYLLRQ